MPPLSIRDWQELVAASPARALAEFRQRCRTLSQPQRDAIWAWGADDAALLRAWAEAPTGPLRGVPFAVKDLFHLRGLPTAAGTAPALVSRAERDSLLVATLAAAGAVAVGKTHLHELAYGLTGENPHYGNVHHPRFPERTTGGSSSGSAAAVAAGIVPLALGTDTGGSIRVPAAFCGLYGLRLTPGDAWIRDAVPLAPAFDTAGWFTASAEDLAIVTSALLGLAPAPRPPRGVWVSADALGWPMAADDAALLARAAARWASPADAATAAQLRAGFADGATTYAVLQSRDAYQIHGDKLTVSPRTLSEPVAQRLARGGSWPSATVIQAEARAAALRLLWTQFFLTYDFLLLPAAPFPALRHDQCDQPQRDALLSLTAPASVAGLPVLTLPVVRPDGLSLGLQLVFSSPTSPVLSWALAQASPR